MVWPIYNKRKYKNPIYFISSIHFMLKGLLLKIQIKIEPSVILLLYIFTYLDIFQFYQK